MADKSTIISLIPFPINEIKPGLYPGHFQIPAAKEDDFEILTVEKSVHYVYLDMDRGSLSVPTTSSDVAKSICEDYKSAKLGYILGHSEPGIFHIEGEYKDKKAILAIAKDKIEHARALQRNWYVKLVEIADDEWAKYRSNKSISDTQRFAAKSLGLDREWNVEAKAEANRFCPACRAVIVDGASICGNCRTIIDPEAYAKFQPALIGKTGA